MSSKSSVKPGSKGLPAVKTKPEAKSERVPNVAETVAAEDNAAQAGSVKMRDLLARVVEATGAKKKDAKGIVEATLVALGAALAKGEDLNLPGVGKVRVAKSLDRDGRALMTLKVRGNGAVKQKQAKEALADPEEAV